ncbi:MAG: hypothetical protein ACRD2L_24220, partial [Terriglobia bacterium]
MKEEPFRATLLVLLAALVGVLFFKLPNVNPSPVPPKAPEPRLALSDFVLDIHNIDGSSGCKKEKPKDIGCTTVCKPCVTWVCRNGEWVR